MIELLFAPLQPIAFMDSEHIAFVKTRIGTNSRATRLNTKRAARHVVMMRRVARRKILTDYGVRLFVSARIITTALQDRLRIGYGHKFGGRDIRMRFYKSADNVVGAKQGSPARGLVSKEISEGSLVDQLVPIKQISTIQQLAFHKQSPHFRLVLLAPPQLSFRHAKEGGIVDIRQAAVNGK